MTRPATLSLCAVMLLAGLVIGAAIDGGPSRGTVHANARNAHEVERLYQELGADGNFLVDSGRQLARIASLTTPSVVHIQSKRRSGSRGMVEETGSGVIVTSPKGSGLFVVTNRHVVTGARTADSDIDLQSVSIQLYDGRTVHPVQVWTDEATDVAILRIVADGLTPARWGDSDQVEIGHIVLAMGSPFGLSRSVTFGIIGAKARRSLKLGAGGAVLNQDFLQTDAAINPGNSGGPLIDMHGRVIGINTAIASNSGGNEGIGFSIPSNLVRRVTEQLVEHGRVQRGYLGVKLDAQFDAEAARRLKLDRLRGARIIEVYPDTPASRAGLRLDDVVLTFDGTEVQDENHLINLVSLTPVGRQVRLEVLRDGRRIPMQLMLGNRADLDQQSALPTRPEFGIPVEPMGLTLHRVDDGLARQLGLEPTARGLLVMNVEAAGPLAAELEPYDLLEEVARRPVTTLDDLAQVLEETADDGPLLLKVRRTTDGEPRSRLLLWHKQ